ncbi:MAG: signal peptidase [Sphingobacteriales bacterium]|nr:signal peptidase [Sphingobacteriales bacterium]
MKSRLIKGFSVLAIISLNIGCDQVSKDIVREKVEYNASIILIDNFLTLTKIENSGAFLSMGDALPSVLKTLLLLILPIAALLYGLVYVLTKKNLAPLSILAICCVIGGGIGNIYDRFLYGSVTDFLHMDFMIFQTGIFNMADVSVMAGMFLLVLEMFIVKKPLQGFKTT